MNGFSPYYYSSYYPSDYYSDYYAGYYPQDYSYGNYPQDYSYGNYPQDYSYGYTAAAAAPRISTYAITGSSTVLLVQRRLAREGYYRGPLDGISGPMTRTAIVRFERNHRLPTYTAINRPLLISLGLA